MVLLEATLLWVGAVWQTFIVKKKMIYWYTRFFDRAHKRRPNFWFFLLFSSLPGDCLFKLKAWHSLVKKLLLTNKHSQFQSIYSPRSRQKIILFNHGSLILFFVPPYFLGLKCCGIAVRTFSIFRFLPNSVTRRYASSSPTPIKSNIRSGSFFEESHARVKWDQTSGVESGMHSKIVGQSVTQAVQKLLLGSTKKR